MAEAAARWRKLSFRIGRMTGSCGTRRFKAYGRIRRPRKVVRDDPISSKTIDSSEGSRRPCRKTQAAVAPTSPAQALAACITTDQRVPSQESLCRIRTRFFIPRTRSPSSTWLTTTNRLPIGCCRMCENRLLSLVRCPAGSGQKCFFQKHPGTERPTIFAAFDVKEKDEVEEYLALYDLAGLVSLVQMGVLEIHIWGSQADQYEKPDRLIFDLDPDPAVDWPQVVTAAKEVRLLLRGTGAWSHSSRRRAARDCISSCRSSAARTGMTPRPSAGRSPTSWWRRRRTDYIAKMSKAARKGKIFVDYLRNDSRCHGHCAVFHPATRREPVSVPITWDELSGRLKSDHFTIH